MLDWKKVEVRWGNLRTRPIEPLLLIRHSPPPKFPEPQGVQIPEVAPQVPATILELAPQARPSTPDSGALTKEEFEPQPILQSGDTLQIQLTKLKSLHDSGAITDAEYKERKRKLLSEV